MSVHNEMVPASRRRRLLPILHLADTSVISYYSIRSARGRPDNTKRRSLVTLFEFCTQSNSSILRSTTCVKLIGEVPRTERRTARFRRGRIEFRYTLRDSQQSVVLMGHAVLIEISNRRLSRVISDIDGHSASRPGPGDCLFQINLRRQLAKKEACHQIIAVG